jgi:hypothetical protein
MLDDNGYDHAFEGRAFLRFSPDGTKMVTYGPRPCQGTADVLIVCAVRAATLLRLGTGMRVVLDATFSGSGEAVFTIASSMCDVWRVSDGAHSKRIDMQQQITHMA